LTLIAVNMKTIILDASRIQRIIQRIAYQVMEHCYKQERITLIGLAPRGTWVADQVVEVLDEMAPFKIDQIALNTDALDALNEASEQIKGRYVILIDDVIKSGNTMMVAAGEIMRYEPHHLITASLVDRKHRRFPIQSDFTGLSLATTIQEHIRLVIEPEPTVFLE
jgi:pyrimidine operon attenuation protein / uracil phosphoribosyltransferase